MLTFRRTVRKLFLAAIVASGSALPVQAETIGISIPLSGDVAELGRAFRAGAKLAMEQLGGEHELFIADDGCDPDLARLAISDLASQQPAIVTGFLCNEAAIIAANQLRESGVPVLVAGARSVRLIKDRSREEWNLWRISPGDDYAYRATAQTIENRWRALPYAVIDDGTIFGRSFTDGLRLVLNEAGLEPQVSDNFRAAQSTQAGLLRRMQRSGVTAAFIAAATSEDLFTIAKNRAELEVNVKLMMSEQMAILPYLEDADKVPAGLMVVKPAHAESDSRRALNQLLRDKNIIPTPQIYEGYAAIEVALAALSETSAETTRQLQEKRFETVNGSVKFNQDGANITNPYKLHVWDGKRLVLPSGETAPTQ